ncbi:MAG: hypothetical protein E7478_03110 [Ruminococcaceae bacterium]|nr:hypothetical protein [Oscillospiraceae bacterium]
MKLSKQERIGVLIIAVAIIIGLGIFFFIVPKFKEVGVNKALLESKQVEYQAAVDKSNLKDGLKNDVIAAYEEGRDLADMFFEEMTPYELDAEVRTFLEYAKKNDHNVVVESVNVSPASTATLSVSFFEESELTYELKTYATQGQQPTKEELDAEARRATLMSQLSQAQTVGASTATFTITALNAEEIVAFIDYINAYEKEEDGKKIRKALMYNGSLGLTFEDVTEKYELIMEEMDIQIKEDAKEELKKNEGDRADTGEDDENQNTAGGNTADTPAEGEGQEGENEDDEDEDDDKVSVSDCLETYDISLTFFFIERMQDPTELLEQQEAA